MEHALKLAVKASVNDEVPVGAVLVDSLGKIIGQGSNSPIQHSDPTSHAEIIAIRQAASKLQNYRLPQTRLYVTIEPCCMCVGAMLHARIKELIYGASEPKAGAVKSHLQLLEADCFNHRIQVRSGICGEASRNLIQNFFQAKRARS